MTSQSLPLEANYLEWDIIKLFQISFPSKIYQSFVFRIVPKVFLSNVYIRRNQDFLKGTPPPVKLSFREIINILFKPIILYWHTLLFNKCSNMLVKCVFFQVLIIKKALLPIFIFYDFLDNKILKNTKNSIWCPLVWSPTCSNWSILRTHRVSNIFAYQYFITVF